MHNSGTAFWTQTKKSAQHKAMANVRREKKYAPQFERQDRHRTVAALRSLSVQPDRGPHRCQEKSVPSEVVDLQGADPMQHHGLSELAVPRNHKGCKERFIERFARLNFGCHRSSSLSQ